MNKFMEIALLEAKKAFKKGEVPIGAVLVCNERILTRAHNNRVNKYLVTGHAEIMVINKACRKSKYWKLCDCELYVTLKPCRMCQEVIREANIRHVYYLLDPLEIKKNRYENEVFIEKIGDEEDCKKYREILGGFFEEKR